MSSPQLDIGFTRFISKQVARYTAFKGYSVLQKEDGRRMDLYEKDQLRLTIEVRADDLQSMVDFSAVVHTPVGPPNLGQVHGALLDMGELMLNSLHANDVFVIEEDSLFLKRRMMAPRAHRSPITRNFQLHIADFESFARKASDALQEKIQYQFRIKLN